MVLSYDKIKTRRDASKEACEVYRLCFNEEEQDTKERPILWQNGGRCGISTVLAADSGVHLGTNALILQKKRPSDESL